MEEMNFLLDLRDSGGRGLRMLCWVSGPLFFLFSSTPAGTHSRDENFPHVGYLLCRYA